ncbi:MAG: hypothetical protein Q9217_002950 [Psora testacea]
MPRHSSNLATTAAFLHSSSSDSSSPDLIMIPAPSSPPLCNHVYQEPRDGIPAYHCGDHWHIRRVGGFSPPRASQDSEPREKKLRTHRSDSRPWMVTTSLVSGFYVLQKERTYPEKCDKVPQGNGEDTKYYRVEDLRREPWPGDMRRNRELKEDFERRNRGGEVGGHALRSSEEQANRAEQR